MRFRNLPSDIKIGSIDLKVFNCASLIPCQLCDCIDSHFVKCHRGHISCTDCAFHLEEERFPKRGEMYWCASCSDWTISTKEEVDEASLRKMTFGCNCGFLGTLSELSQHLQSSDTDNKCHRTSGRRTHELLEAELHSNFDKVAEKLDTLECEFEQVVVLWKDTATLLEKFSRTVEFALARHQIKVHYFDVYSLANPSGGFTDYCEDLWNYNGVDYYICLGLNIVRDVSWIALSVRTEHTGAQKCFPQSKHVFRLHDLYGGVMVELSIWASAHGTFAYYDPVSRKMLPVESLPLLPKEVVFKDAFFHDGKTILSVEYVPTGG